MSTDASFIAYLSDQMADAGAITFRKMFGEYAVYLNGKVVALVCDNQVFVKPTEAGRRLLGEELTEAPPYPGAKMFFNVTDGLDDREALAVLLRATECALPAPKPRRARAKPAR